MITSVNSNISALQAFSKQIGVSANNVANALSDNFKKSSAVNTEGENGQVQTTITKVNTPGPLVDDPLSTTGELKELSNTDIAEEMVNQIIASQGYKANTKVIKTYEETIGSLIDLIG
ncbi:MAG: flagellar basal body rod C-terminal domain-containing protein [Desulfobacula sp.]|jgi:flagellar basal-body rod protein FlgC